MLGAFGVSMLGAFGASILSSPPLLQTTNTTLQRLVD